MRKYDVSMIQNKQIRGIYDTRQLNTRYLWYKMSKYEVSMIQDKQIRGIYDVRGILKNNK